MGGIAGGAPTSAVNVYDPMTDTWTVAAPLPAAEAQFGAGVINSKSEVFGPNLENVEYDPATNAWSTLTTTGPSAANLTGVSASTSGGLLYSIGGYDSLLNPAGTSAFDPVTKTWTAKEAPTLLAGLGPAGNPLGINTTAQSSVAIYEPPLPYQLALEPAALNHRQDARV